MITYGDATPTISASGLQNGDVLTASIDDESYTDHGGGTSYLDVKGAVDGNGDFQVHSYSISSNLGALGYNVSTGSIQVDQKR